MFDILPILKGWHYKFPYFQEFVNITRKGYTLLYDSSKSYKRGAIVYATLVTDTPNYRLKLSTGETVLHEIAIRGLLYGQSPSGFSTPSGLLANVYMPIIETELNYSIPVGNPEYKPATAVALLSADWFPFKENIRLEVKPQYPPMLIYETGIGIISIEEEEYIKNLKEIFGGDVKRQH